LREDISAPARAAMFSEATSELMLYFLELVIPGGTLRFVNDWVNHVRGGDTYIGYQFTITLPDEVKEGIPIVMLRISNVIPDILGVILTLTDPVPVTLNAALSSSPNTTEAGPFSFNITNVDWDHEYVTAQLTYDDIMLESFPGFRVTPRTHPASF